jgi:hypothetical protein
MSPINPDGSVSRETPRGLLEWLVASVGALTSNPLKTVTAALGALLMAFALAVAVWQISSGWLVGSAVVPITFMAGLLAAKLAIEVRWS